MAHPGGRPPHFQTKEDLQLAVDEYFEYIKGEFHMEDQEIYSAKTDEFKIIAVKVWDRHPEPVTITGIALFLGFESRQSFYDYEKNAEFSYIIKKARTLVEHGYEKRLSDDKPTGAIFALKNMGWNDAKQEETPDGEQVKDLIIKAASAIVHGSK